MYWNGSKIVTFDIETQGLDVNSNIICINTYDGDKCNVYYSIEKFMKQNFDNKILVGFNSDSWRGGFDLNFIRTLCVKNDIDYILYGVAHLDIFPLIKTNFNTTIQYNKLSSVSSLRKNDLLKLADANDIEYSTKKDTYKRIKQLDEPEWLEYIKVKHKEKNDLQSVYQMWFDPNKEEEYISGADTDKLLQEGNIGEVVKHCSNDIIRTYKLAEKVLDLVPEYQINKSLTSL
jgi:uncharacterized protein YprB with RNaseH-like and TPR domain